MRDCICRVQQDLIHERKCGNPLEVCLNFSSSERPSSDREISLEEALKIIEKADRAGLVHSVSNITEGFGYVCNCCGCCCGILRGITKFGIKNSVAAANYYAVIDADACEGCDSCLCRCQVNAISKVDEICVVDRDKCIGCGLCVSGCKSGATQLVLKPGDEIIHPPTDFGAWEQERLKNRGITSS